MKKIKKATGRRSSWLLLGLAAAAIVLGAALLPGGGETPVPSAPTVDEPLVLPTQPPEIDLGQGLTIERLGSYAGRYMEDGTNDVVQDVLMLLLRNDTEQDLQLARIRVEYPDFTAEFEVTSLPAGERAVLLEKTRRACPDEEHLGVSVQNVVFFPEKMDLMPQVLELGGTPGVVEATNISDTDLTGPVYIYYKNSSEDLLYGGITYRVLIEGGIGAGETIRMPAGHYDPADCRFVMVTTAG